MKEKKFIRNIDGDIIENEKNGLEIFDILSEGDLLRIEYFSLRYGKRISRLFEVESIFNNRLYIQLSNHHCDFVIYNGEFLPQDAELNPVIISIIPIEKLNTIEYNLCQGMILKR